MPIYEYQCDNCGHQFELLQKVSDPVISQCPQCNQEEAKRLVSATSFRLKGSGWYETDFKNKSKLADKTSSSKDNGESKASSDNSKKTETKSTTSTDTKSSA